MSLQEGEGHRDTGQACEHRRPVGGRGGSRFKPRNAGSPEAGGGEKRLALEPSEGAALPRPRFHISGFQNSERTNFCCFYAPGFGALCVSSPRAVQTSVGCMDRSTSLALLVLDVLTCKMGCPWTPICSTHVAEHLLCGQHWIARRELNKQEHLSP